VSIREEHYCFVARLKIRDVAMSLARAGLSDETIREAMADMAQTEAERAIAWAAKEDARQAAADRDPSYQDEVSP
jgi:SOS response regulatory protein OraA/RecX